jgi:hypothetical protein
MDYRVTSFGFAVFEFLCDINAEFFLGVWLGGVNTPPSYVVFNMFRLLTFSM